VTRLSPDLHSPRHFLFPISHLFRFLIGSFFLCLSTLYAGDYRPISSFLPFLIVRSVLCPLRALFLSAFIDHASVALLLPSPRFCSLFDNSAAYFLRSVTLGIWFSFFFYSYGVRAGLLLIFSSRTHTSYRPLSRFAISARKSHLACYSFLLLLDSYWVRDLLDKPLISVTFCFFFLVSRLFLFFFPRFPRTLP